MVVGRGKVGRLKRGGSWGEVLPRCLRLHVILSSNILFHHQDKHQGTSYNLNSLYTSQKLIFISLEEAKRTPNQLLDHQS